MTRSTDDAKPIATVVIPTRNRHTPLRTTVASLTDQTFPAASYEIIVVDDGSSPPVSGLQPAVRLLRLEGAERSAARNTGAAAARSEVLIFVDDDMTVQRDFIAQHVEAQRQWPRLLAVGSVALSPLICQTAFGRFRQKLERQGMPEQRGIVTQRNFCTAQNMSIPASVFASIGGFDPQLNSSEDQDLALRHTAAGGLIAYLPEAEAVHHDHAVSLRAYCRRNEWGYDNLLGFMLRNPDLSDNVDRVRINGPLRLGREPLRLSAAKSAKMIAGFRPVQELLFAAIALLERVVPRSRLLERLYAFALGVFIYRGFRRGWRRHQRSGTGPVLLADA